MLFSYNILDMVKEIEIEYCGSWGYGGPANSLKNAIAQKFPDAKFNLHSANGKTGVIKVVLTENGQKREIWSQGRDATNKNHQQIIELLGKWNEVWKKKIES